MESQEVLTARRVLLSAVMQGRKRPAKLLVGFFLWHNLSC
ncbi:hypothetical protein DUNSADRAFT_6074 [Dunaliella salina]|uniref:Uncharacterized protein n=1 Tax=Dunaliella salina TaxID=3046 RepID=A0ABQ7FU50_DUNSA|nr:hypothetical protein DUNSADRAFT_6074 [Dunaliella salina]|eukprot:KAF5825895.1 hypothetical protein DUNSADRAFT_6074 [Dunaliella salina]